MSSVILLPARSPCPLLPSAAGPGRRRPDTTIKRWDCTDFPPPAARHARLTEAFLARDRLVGHRDQRGWVGEDLLLGGEQPGLGGGQGDGLRRPRVAGRRPGEPQRGGEVAAGAAAEGGDVRLGDAEPLLDDADQRGVVEYVRADPAARGPRRDDDRRDPEAEPDRLAAHVLAARPAGRDRRG